MLILIDEVVGIAKKMKNLYLKEYWTISKSNMKKLYEWT